MYNETSTFFLNYGAIEILLIIRTLKEMVMSHLDKKTREHFVGLEAVDEDESEAEDFDMLE